MKNIFLSLLLLFIISCGSRFQTAADSAPSAPTLPSDNNGGNSGSQNPPSTPAPGADCVKATVSWTAPTTRIDGTPITPGELAGYKIYVGLASKEYTKEIVIKDANALNYEIFGLTQNVTYYFAMKSVDSAGLESEYTNEVTFLALNCVAP